MKMPTLHSFQHARGLGMPPDTTPPKWSYTPTDRGRANYLSLLWLSDSIDVVMSQFCIFRTNRVTYMTLKDNRLNDLPYNLYRGNPFIVGRFTRPGFVIMRLIILGGLFTMHAPAVVAQPSTSHKAITTLQSILGARRLDFVNYQSEHFLLATDADKTTATSTLHELEDTYQHVLRWADVLQLSVTAAQQVWPVVYFVHQKDYRLTCERMGVTPIHETGLYAPLQHVVIFQDVANDEQWQAVNERIAQLQLAIRKRSSQSAKESKDQLRQMRDQLKNLQAGKNDIHNRYQQLVIRHEAAHMVLCGLGILNSGVSNPDWLTEGLACQFEVPASKKENFVDNPLRLEDLKNALTHDNPPAIAPLLTFVNKATFSYRSARESSWAYAQAWAVVHYLQTNRPKPFATYLTCQASLASSSANHLTSSCFQRAFLVVPGQLASNWLTWLTSLKLNRSEG